MLGEGVSGWRRDVLDSAVAWTVRLGSILALALLASFIPQRPLRLLEPSVVFMFAAYAGVIVLRVRTTLPYALRSHGFCALLIVMGVAGLFGLGALPGPVLVCAFVVLTAQLFCGPHAMLMALALTSGAVVIS